MARMDSRVRCSRPQRTTYSTASRTLSHEVWNDSAVSFQESLRAQRARKSIWALVEECLPSLQGSSSATTPHWKVIVSRRWLLAPRADGRGSLSRPHGHFDGFLVGAEAGVLVNESPMMMTVV